MFIYLEKEKRIFTAKSIDAKLKVTGSSPVFVLDEVEQLDSSSVRKTRSC